MRPHAVGAGITELHVLMTEALRRLNVNTDVLIQHCSSSAGVAEVCRTVQHTSRGAQCMKHTYALFDYLTPDFLLPSVLACPS